MPLASTNCVGAVWWVSAVMSQHPLKGARPGPRRSSERYARGLVAEAVGDAELLEQRLGLEVSDPDRGDLPVSDGPAVDDLDHRIGAPDTLVDDRVDTAVPGDNTDVAE